jgi:hypothetical protein
VGRVFFFCATGTLTGSARNASADVRLGDHAGAEGVAEVVEAELAEVALLERGVVAAA